MLAITCLMANIYAQKLFLRPQFGVFQSVSQLKNNGSDNSIFKAYKFKSPEVSALICLGMVYSTKKLNLEIGYKYSSSSMAVYSIPHQYTFTTSNNNKYERYTARGINQHSFSLNYFHTSHKNINILPIKRKKSLKSLPSEDTETLYLISMRIKPMIGLAINIGESKKRESDTVVQYTIYTESKMEGRFNYKTSNKFGAAFQLGITFQFYKFEKERLAFNIWYNKGLSIMTTARYDFIVNDTYFYSTDIISRGSYLGFTASYPILLWSKKKL